MTLPRNFLDELGKLTKSVSKSKVAPDSEWIFFRCGFERRSRRLAEKSPNQMKGAAALWIVYPKGQKQITENGCSRRRPQVAA